MTNLKDLIREDIINHFNEKESDGTPIAPDLEVLLDEIVETIKVYFEKSLR